MCLVHRLTAIGLAIAAEVSIARATELPLGEPVRVGITLAGVDSGVVQYVALMIAEAGGIWRRYGVTVLHTSDDLARVDVRLNVILQSRNVPAGGRRRDYRAYADEGLGAIVFDTSGRPAATIALNLHAIAATIERTPAAVWPPVPTMARALGRVLAHEIGHYVLALPAHAPSGLMRANFAAGELAEAGRHNFALSAELLPRLRARLQRLRCEAAAIEREKCPIEMTPSMCPGDGALRSVQCQ
jgi:hypothetical protein